MLSINLLPQNLKNELKLKSLSSSINKMIATFSFFVVIFIALLYSSLIYLNTYYQNKQSVSTSMSKNTESYTNELLTINKSLKFISTAQSNYVEWTGLFYQLGKFADKDLSFKSLVIDKKSNTVSISAHAKTRESLLSFKEKIENNKNLSGVVFPLKTLFEKNNIDFNITATITSYEFSKL